MVVLHLIIQNTLTDTLSFFSLTTLSFKKYVNLGKLALIFRNYNKIYNLDCINLIFLFRKNVIATLLLGCKKYSIESEV